MAEPTAAAINVDEVMRSIREEVKQRQTCEGEQFAAAHKGFNAWSRMEELVAGARRLADVGKQLPAMTQTRGLKRMVATPVAWAVLRLAQLVTRDQRAFNHAATDGLAHLHQQLADELDQVRAELQEVRTQLAEAQRRAEATRSSTST